MSSVCLYYEYLSMVLLSEQSVCNVSLVRQVSWGAARAFCAATGGDLLTLADLTHYVAVVHHLRQARESLPPHTHITCLTGHLSEKVVNRVCSTNAIITESY